MIAGIIGLGIKMAGEIGGAISESEAAAHNAKVAREQAVVTRQQTQEELRTFRVFSRKHLADMRSNMAMSGIEFDGSFKDVQDAAENEVEMDAAKILYNGELKAQGLENDAKLYDKRQSGAAWGGALGVGGTLASGTSDLATKYGYKMPKNGEA